MPVLCVDRGWRGRFRHRPPFIDSYSYVILILIFSIKLWAASKAAPKIERYPPAPASSVETDG
jgi:hypothetical protein